MASPPLPKGLLSELVGLVEQYLREGYDRHPRSGPGAVKMAGREGVRRGWFKNADQAFHWLEAAKERYSLEPDWTLYRPARYQQPVPAAQLRHAAPPNPEIAIPAGEPELVLVIPDRHNDPRHEHRLACTTWIARLGSERRARVVVDLGDAVTFDSVSRHDRNETARGRLKPPIRADLDNHVAALQAFERGRAADWKPKKLKTRGNHEQRLWLFENEHPESEGSHTHQYSEALAQFGWRERDFGEFVYVEGVAFSHAPFNGMGKPMSGKTATHRAGDLLSCTLVHGHTHALQVYSAAKSGPLERLNVIQAGCALPWGEYEHYASVGPGGWWWGCLVLTVWGGQVVDLEAVSMLRLRERYSDHGGDVRAA